MKILYVGQAHYNRGGAEVVYLRTGDLFESHGHEPVYFSMAHPQNKPCPTSEYFVSCVDFNARHGLRESLRIAGRILYSLEAYKNISSLLNKYQVDVVHLHNIYHNISPSILHAIKKRNIPIVMTLHDYKLVCGAHSMLNGDKLCEDCKDERYFMSIKNACIKNSLIKSTLSCLEMYLHHKILNIYNKIDFFISPSMFLKNKFMEMGFGKEIYYLPNFLDLNEINIDGSPNEQIQENRENLFIFTGRLSREKGIITLIKAVRILNRRKVKVKLNIIGTGPLESEIISIIDRENLCNIELMGYKDHQTIYEMIMNSTALILPSEWYENNPLTVIESFALGKPVIASRIGGIPELVRDFETGLTYEARSAEDLCDKIQYFIENPHQVRKMGNKARLYVEKRLNADDHYRELSVIYERLIKSKRSRQVKRNIVDDHRQRLDIEYKWAWYLLAMISFLLYFSGIVTLHNYVRRRIFKRKIVLILTYHRVSNDKLTPDLSVAPHNFNRQITYLKDNFNVISLDELVENHIGQNKELHGDTIAITFDDGFKDNFLNAFPIMEKHGVPGTIFVSINYLNEEHALSIDDMLTMNRRGISFGAHTINHRRLSYLDKENVAREIDLSRKRLEEILGENSISFFAYPYGKKNRDFTTETMDIVEKLGFFAAVSTDNGLIDNESECYSLPRIGIRNFPLFVFKTRVSGIIENRLVHTVRRLINI